MENEQATWKCEDNFNGKKVLVLGAGNSGLSSAKFLRSRGAIVGLYDDKKGECIKEAIYLHDMRRIDAEMFDFCVISPGVSINHPVARKFVDDDNKCRILSELSLGFMALHKKIVAVTGTNGKTTVTKMIGEALGNKGIICGNIGVPVTSVSKDIAKKIAVTEVSSFMLETDNGFNADIAIILNITQDHLERHGTMAEYVRCKAKLACSGTVILNYDDLNCRVLNDGRAFYFSAVSPVRGIYLDGKNIVLNIGKQPKTIFSLEDFCEDRPHQITNILAVVLACVLLKVPKKRILAACMGERPSEHRIQTVAEIGNISFVNDSKATNIAACLAACKCFFSPISLLLGGLVKNQNFDELFENLPSHVEYVFAFGAGADEIIASSIRLGFARIAKFKTMKDALVAAKNYGIGPRVVLLSPACSSFDEFTSYADRGARFTEFVKELQADDMRDKKNRENDEKREIDNNRKVENKSDVKKNDENRKMSSSIETIKNKENCNCHNIEKDKDDKIISSIKNSETEVIIETIGGFDGKL